MSMRHFALEVSLVIAGITSIVIGGEIALRVVGPYTHGYWIWPAGVHRTFHPDPTIFPGITGTSEVRISSAGVRGDEFSDQQDIRILAIGGSTTICVYLDQTEAWPSVLQTRLNGGNSRVNVWVGNLGMSGFSTRHHILQMKYQLAQFPKIDIIIMMVGANDFGLRLLRDVQYDPEYLQRDGAEQVQMRRTFCFYPIHKGELLSLKNTVWWRLVHSARIALFSEKVQDATGKRLQLMRERRSKAKILVERLPDLQSALKEYERNLRTIIDLGRRNSIRMIFLTQPSIWRPDLTAREKGLLWGGGIGHFEERQVDRYYSVSAMIRGLGLYNGTLREVCRSEGVECIDLASMLPKDTTVFYDDYHFNESGARLVAEIIAKYLNNHAPLVRHKKR